ncbi:MAG TPA: metallophosphoesterase, partial [Pseudomonadales bacterium]
MLASLWFVTSHAAAAQDAPQRWSGIERVVAFGDVHGAYDALIPLLQQAGVIDAQLRWSGGATHLVSLGDLLDRGPDSRDVLDLLMRLETEASKAGGFVHVVLGNHEVMNLAGDLRYVSAAEYAAFAPPPGTPLPEPVDGMPPQVPSGTPPIPGAVEHRQAFSADGVYGRWLLGKPLLIVINDTVFVHGGLPQAIGALGLDAGNAQFHTELMQALNLPGAAEGPLLSQKGPLWYRGTARCHVLLEGDGLRRTLKQLSARRVAIGHTPTAIRRAQSRFAGDVVMLDTGMLAEVYHGRASALVIEGGIDRVVVAGDTSVPTVLPEPGGYAGDWVEGDRRAKELEAAAVVRSSGVANGAKGEREVTLAGAGNTEFTARFVPLSGQRARHEAAAYRIDRLLQLGIVPPTVVREIDGNRGVLVAVGNGWTSESARAASATARANDCEWGSDYLLMQAFDALIGNPTRSVENFGYDRISGQLELRDNGDAFASTLLRSDPAREWPQLPSALRTRLAALDANAIAAAVGTQL